MRKKTTVIEENGLKITIIEGPGFVVKRLHNPVRLSDLLLVPSDEFLKASDHMMKAMG